MNITNQLKQLFLPLFVLLFSLYSGNSFARDYYVSTTGYNGNNGEIDSPFQTISKAADLAVAGDNVIIREGTYWEQVSVKNSGSADQYITFQPYGDEKVTINGDGISVPYWQGLFNVGSKSHIKIIGLNVINSNQSGIFGHKINNIIVSKCYTHNTNSSGIGMHFGHDITIDGNEVELANTEGSQENISIENIVNFEVSNNHVHNGGSSSQGGEGIDVKGESHNGKVSGNRVHHIKRQGIYVDAYDSSLTNIEINNNTVYSNALTGIQVGTEAGGFLEDIRIFNNVVYENEWSGINVWGGGVSGKSHGMRNIYITDNTVVKNGWTPWGTGISSDNDEADNVVILNNIVSQNTGMQIRIAPELSLSKYNIQNNLVDNSNRQWEQQGSGDTLGHNAINALPEFVDFNNNDFHLKSNSPAIGSGLAEGGASTVDFDFKTRSNDTGATIGAFHP